MSDDFDLAHDKLPDQPVTIGGDKSAAAWHPNSGPEVPHADLIARLRREASEDRRISALAKQKHTKRQLDQRAAFSEEAADALAALSNTVPREQHDQVCAMHDASAQSARDFWQRVEKSERERDEARAERDALGHVIEQARAVAGLLRPWNVTPEQLENLGRILDTAPAVSLTRADEAAS